MSDFDSLLSKLSETYSLVASLEMEAREKPHDEFVLAEVSSLKSFAAQLEAEWEQESRYSQMEICRYRMVSIIDDTYLASGVSRSILYFQELFSQIHDAILHGPKSRARIPESTLSETNLNLAFTYPGSLGMVFTIPGESTLISDKYDQTVDAMFQIMEVGDEFAVRDLSQTLGAAVVKKAFDWSKSNYNSGYGVDVAWTTSSGKKKGNLIERDDFGKLVDIIGQTSDKELSILDVQGVLVGLDIKTKRFRFLQLGADERDFTGYLKEGFPISRHWEINAVYTAKIETESITQYATETTKETYSLIQLESQPDS